MIVIRLKGGHGNQMFQYARGRVLAIKYKTQLSIDLNYFKNKNFTPREYNLDQFNIKAKIIEKSKIPFLLKYLLPVIKKINWNGNIYLDGYFQSEKYFKKYSDIIREDFTLKEIPTKTEDLIKEIKNCNSVCMHIRRGDYVGNKLHQVQDIYYYKKAIMELEKKVKIDNIYIFSDDIIWCKENIKFNYKITFVNKEELNITDVEELCIMTNCKYFIIANSSFSWWGAWLAPNKEKIVICPEKWYSNESIDTSDLIPESWIRI
ncbi:alpha-1,2-fucosyltransferase [Candidatus Nomurabacteria bacterium]|nr:alpha-1,2-fucosyltransferase [Candidatus Nomurabacteria bacterium]